MTFDLGEPTPERRRKGTALTVLVLVAMAAAILAVLHTAASHYDGSSTPAPRPNAAPAASVTDARYLAVLHSETESWGGRSDATLIDLGHRACTALGDGNTVSSVSMALSYMTDLPLDQSSYLTGAAVGAYCPRYADEVSA